MRVLLILPHLALYDTTDALMRIRVETHVGPDGVERPKTVHFDARLIEVVETLDQWHGAEYRYFKVLAGDGNLYILRLDEPRAEWELTMFQDVDALAEPARFHGCHS